MANNYAPCSFAVKCPDKLAFDWLEAKVNFHPECTCFDKGDCEIEIKCPYCEDLHCYGIDAEKLEGRGENILWIYSEEGGNYDQLSKVLQEYLQLFEPTGLIAFTWCEYCDKPRLDEFGGGCFMIDKDNIELVHTNQFCEIFRSGGNPWD